MTQQEAIKILNAPGSKKEALRRALAFALGVEYCPPTQEKQQSMFKRMQVVFCEAYRKHSGVDYAMAGRDFKALKDILGKLQKVFPDITDDSTVTTWKHMLQKMPEWYRKNAFTLTAINGGFNSIINSIKNGTGQQQGISEEFRQKIADDLQT